MTSDSPVSSPLCLRELDTAADDWHGAHATAGVILLLGPRDYSVLAQVRDEDDTPVYRVAENRIKAASTAAVLARKLGRGRSCWTAATFMVAPRGLVPSALRPIAGFVRVLRVA